MLQSLFCQTLLHTNIKNTKFRMFGCLLLNHAITAEQMRINSVCPELHIIYIKESIAQLVERCLET